MSAKLNMNLQSPIQWKGNLFSQNSSSIQKNVPSTMTGHSLLFKPNSLNIYRRETNSELVKNTPTRTISRASTKYNLINLPNGSVLSPTTAGDCPEYTQEILMPNTSCTHDISNNLCLSSESSAKRRCRSGLIYNKKIENRGTDTYFISSSQYLANRNKSYDKNMNVYMNVGAKCLSTHEPSNPQFYEQGAVFSSSHIAKVKFNEITQSGVLLHGHAGTGIENALAYNVGLTAYSYKHKLGNKLPLTPHFNEVDIVVPKIRNTTSYFYNKNVFTNTAIYVEGYDIVTVVADTLIQFSDMKNIEYIVVGGGGSTKVLTSVPGVVSGGGGGKVNQGTLECRKTTYTIQVGTTSDPLMDGNPSAILLDNQPLVLSEGGLCGQLNIYEVGSLNKYAKGGNGASAIAVNRNGAIGDSVNANLVPIIASTTYRPFIFGYGGGGGSRDISNALPATGRSVHYGTGGNYLVMSPPKPVLAHSGDGAGGYGSLIQPYKPESGAAGIVILAIPKINVLKCVQNIGNKTSCT